LSKLQEDRSTHDDPEETWQLAAEAQLRVVLLPLILLFKHPSFSAEGESRLAYLLGSVGIANDDRQLKHREGRGFVIPYLPLPFADESAEHIELGYTPEEAALPILSVRCGPTTHASLGKAGVETLMERYRYDDVRVEVSEVPYRD
jgi:hypothetical protein